MSVEGLKLPGCPAVAWHKDYPTHTFYCDLPLAHEGRHGHHIALGVWVHWEVTMNFSSTTPPNPADTPADTAPSHPHSNHPKGEWLYSCCACSGLYDPGCPGCNPNADPGER